MDNHINQESKLKKLKFLIAFKVMCDNKIKFSGTTLCKDYLINRGLPTVMELMGGVSRSGEGHWYWLWSGPIDMVLVGKIDDAFRDYSRKPFEFISSQQIKEEPTKEEQLNPDNFSFWKDDLLRIEKKIDKILKAFSINE